MRFLALISLFPLFISFCLAQDGSDIIYVREPGIDSSMVGKDIHIDFYKNSFGNNSFAGPKRSQVKDTVSLNFLQENIPFLEVRNDNGFNNWFAEQYLESVDVFDDRKLRIEKLKLLQVWKDSISVKVFGHYFDVLGNPNPLAHSLDTLRISRKVIYQILIHSIESPDGRIGYLPGLLRSS